MGLFKSVTKVFKSVSKVFKVIKTFKFFSKINPWVALGVFAIGWLYFSSRRPESPDFGDSDFNNFEKGLFLLFMELEKLVVRESL